MLKSVSLVGMDVFGGGVRDVRCEVCSDLRGKFWRSGLYCWRS